MTKSASNYKKTSTEQGRTFFTRVTLEEETKKRGRKRQWLKKLLRSRFVWGVVGSFCLTTAILIIIGLVYYARMLPDISGLAAAKEQPGIEVLAGDGSIITRYGQIGGQYIPFRELPKDLINAVVATEDRKFFSHFGVDPFGIARAFFANIRAGRTVQGGSTITQQLAKNIFLSTDRTLERKIQELMMSFWLEQKFTKEEILAIYLNRVYLGGGSYGVDAAARFYFDKPVSDINLIESAMLAGLLKAPSRYNPTASSDLARKRTEQVIRNMEDAGYIDAATADAAVTSLAADDITARVKEQIPVTKPVRFKTTLHDNGHYFADWVKEQLPEYMGELTEDITVQTTLNADWQHYAEEAVATYLSDDVSMQRHIGEVALLSMRPDGAVVSMIGGRDYNDSQYNRATQAMRQPGSLFKMFVYLAAMQEGYLPEMMFMDEPVSIGNWTPKNYKNEYRGLISLREALAFSINTVAVRLTDMVGIAKIQKVARKLGIKSDLPNLPSIALGSLEVTLEEMVTAFAHLASDGRAVKPYGIVSIARKRDGKPLYTRSDRDDFSNVVVLKPDDVHKMNLMLSDVMAEGTGRGAAIGRSSGGKTGTTSNYKDAWFIGYTPQLVSGVWVGNDDATPMKNVTGGSVPAQIYREYMRNALETVAASNLPVDYSRQVREDLLPWLQQEEAPETLDGEDAPAGTLKKSFWDTLFGSEEVPVSSPEPFEQR